MNRRSGATLVEVLVAMFVMAIGLLSLLALFPLGVLTMAQAVQDDRTANAAASATAIAIVRDIRHDPMVMLLFPNSNSTDGTYANAPPDGPSYPVYVDPAGFQSYFGNYRLFVGGQSYGVPRATVSFVGSSSQLALQWFSLLDDLTFGDDGTPQPITAGTLERENLYSWAYLLRRPRTGDASVVELSVIAYNRRSLSFNNSLQADEIAYSNCSYDTSRNIVTLTWNPAAGDVPPSVRVGSWIMDTTPVPDPNNPGKFGPPHAYFYRVVGVTETSDTSVDVEVQTPFRAFPAGQVTPGTVVVVDGVAEVFEKGTGWRP